MPFFRLQPLLGEDPLEPPPHPHPAFVFGRSVTFTFHGSLLGGALSVILERVTAPSHCHRPAPTPCPPGDPGRGSSHR